MPIYLVIAYIIFTVVPSGLWLLIYFRQRRLLRELALLDQG
jgi:hypothetical protein